MTEQLLMRKALVVGQHFIKDDDGKEAIAQLEPGSEVAIVHDDKNEYDHYAASVRVNDVHVGYISGEISPVLCLMASNGYDVKGEIVELEVNRQKNYTLSVSATLSS